ncbi:MAG: hypothetical protein AAFX79_13030 [Planctomycetota bacterium]
MPTQATPSIDVQTETATGRGWRYGVVVTRDGEASDHTVTLCHQDHDFWCGGAWPPSRLVERLLALVLDHLGDADAPGTLPTAFDCTTARRWLPGLDDLLRHASARGGAMLPGV